MSAAVIDIIIHLLLALLMPPLVLGVINRTKALFAGRNGAPLLQPYYDICRLLRKGSVFSQASTAVFRLGPLVTLGATLVALLLVPFGQHQAPVSFSGDMILFAYLFALGRFFTTAAAMDTASSFEGMGAAREVTFGCLAEPTLFFVLVTLSRVSGSLSLSDMFSSVSFELWLREGAPLLLLTGALFIVLLAENCRIPFDDPNTHLELTMIHEVMVLDHSGPGFAVALYAAALKLYAFGALLIHLVFPFTTGNHLLDWVSFTFLMLLLGTAIGIVESVTARFRMVKVPQILVMATILSAFSALLVMR